MIRILLVLYFILASLRYRVAPWRFFQLNGQYFNEEKGLFSKLDIDRIIPERWRLRQEQDDGITLPASFPVFVEPEWGQNSYGVFRADSAEMLQEIRTDNRRIRIPFLLQGAAQGSLELEIFYIRSARDFADYAILTVTETVHSGGERLPVNSVHNPPTQYRDRTTEFAEAELQQLWGILCNIGCFRIARVGLRTDSLQEMLAGNFQIIEINIFLPMPLSLLDTAVSWREKHRFIVRSMAAAARMVATIPPDQKNRRIFFRKLRMHYRLTS